VSGVSGNIAEVNFGKTYISYSNAYAYFNVYKANIDFLYRQVFQSGDYLA
jgi:hypothetical protein